MELNSFYKKMDEWSAAGIPYLFIIDFEKQKPILKRLSELDNKEAAIWYSFPMMSNKDIWATTGDRLTNLKLAKQAQDFELYHEKFERAQQLFQEKGVRVINLTMPTAVHLPASMETIFQEAEAKYKILYKNHFVCCTPEIFVRIDKNGIIRSYPMKGTIDANIPNAEELILKNPKEEREHRSTVEQLIADLSVVSSKVTVPRYRYIDRLHTTDKDLLQVSSEVRGELKDKYKRAYGSLLDCILPAGSIVGAPRDKALAVIKEVEGYTRSYYTGVCGLFDGEALDSCVLIRIIEQEEDGFFYKSGGGITADSTAESEYRELIDKIYVPLA